MVNINSGLPQDLAQQLAAQQASQKPVEAVEKPPEEIMLSNLPGGESPPPPELPISGEPIIIAKKDAIVGLPLYVMKCELGKHGLDIVDMQSCKVTEVGTPEGNPTVEIYTDKNGKICKNSEGRPFAAINLHYEIVVEDKNNRGTFKKVIIDSSVCSNIPIPIGGTKEEKETFDQKIADALFIAKQQSRSVFMACGGSGYGGYGKVSKNRADKLTQEAYIKYSYSTIDYNAPQKGGGWLPGIGAFLSDSSLLLPSFLYSDEAARKKYYDKFSSNIAASTHTLMRGTLDVNKPQQQIKIINMICSEKLARHMMSKLPSARPVVCCFEMDRHDMRVEELERGISPNDINGDQMKLLVDEEVRKAQEGLDALKKELDGMKKAISGVEDKQKELKKLPTVLASRTKEDREKAEKLTTEMNNLIWKAEDYNVKIDKMQKGAEKYVSVVEALETKLAKELSTIKDISDEQKEACEKKLKGCQSDYVARSRDIIDLRSKLNSLTAPAPELELPQAESGPSAQVHRSSSNQPEETTQPKSQQKPPSDPLIVGQESLFRNPVTGPNPLPPKPQT